MPRHVPDFTNRLSQQAVQCAKLWVALNRGTGAAESGISDIEAQLKQVEQEIKQAAAPWSTQQTNVFLEHLLTSTQPADGGSPSPFKTVLLLKIDAFFNFSHSKNSEIMFRWQVVL